MYTNIKFSVRSLLIAIIVIGLCIMLFSASFVSVKSNNSLTRYFVGGFGSSLLMFPSVQARALELEEEELTGERPELPSMITVKSTESDYIIQLKKSFIYKIEESLHYEPF